VWPDHPDQHSRDQLVAFQREHVAGGGSDGEHGALCVVCDAAGVGRRREDVTGADEDVGGDVVEHLERIGSVMTHEVLVEADHCVAGRAEPVDGVELS